MKLQKKWQVDSRAPNTDMFHKIYQHTARKRCNKYIGDTGSTKLNLDQKKICSMIGLKPRILAENRFWKTYIYPSLVNLVFGSTPPTNCNFFQLMTTKKNLSNQTLPVNLKVSFKGKKSDFQKKEHYLN